MASTSTPISNDAINQSAFRLFSMGRVAANKELNSTLVEVTPIEDAAGLAGEITDHIYKYKSKGTDARGKGYQTEVDTTATIKCEWLGMGEGNRMTAPDVRRGELVRIFRVGNSEKFFWDITGPNFAQRRLETVVHAYSATKEEDVPLDEKNSYVTEVSTHKKMVRLISTSMANGEPFKYDIFVNTDLGQVVIQDNIGNQIVLTSKENRIFLINHDKSIVDINKRNITISAPQEIILNAQKMTVNVPKTDFNGDQKTTGTVEGGVVKQGSIVLGTHTHTGRGVGSPR